MKNSSSEEEQPTSVESKDEACKQDTDSEQDRDSKTNASPNNSDNMKGCKDKRNRHHSAPQERAPGK